MKIAGRKIEGPNYEIIIIPRTVGDIILKAEAILDYNEFEKKYPEPKPPKITKRGEGVKEDFNDPGYLQNVKQYYKAKTGWTCITSLKATEGLEWETVKFDDPNTWANFETELEKSGFTTYEINRILAGVYAANGLSDSKIEEAKKRFLAGMGTEHHVQSFPNGVQSTIQSGVPVKD